MILQSVATPFELLASIGSLATVFRQKTKIQPASKKEEETKNIRERKEEEKKKWGMKR